MTRTRRSAATIAASLATLLMGVLGTALSRPAGALPPSQQAPASAAVTAGGQPGWQWPLPPPVHIVRGFDPPAEPWLPGHRGVDLAGQVGERVTAAGAGVVTYVGSIAGVPIVSITSGDLRTTYEPVTPQVRRGEQVTTGQPIGRLALAGSHCLPAACLHWGLLRGASYLDPLALLGLEQVRLLPLSSVGDYEAGAASRCRRASRAAAARPWYASGRSGFR